MYTPEEMKAIQANAGKPGFNEYGVPLHACNGYRHDEHYWEHIRTVVKNHSAHYWAYIRAINKLTR
jgi:hypothetical protein